jgi:hypothetical protein
LNSEQGVRSHGATECVARAPASAREAVCRYCLNARGPLVGVDRRRGIHHECALETIANGTVEDDMPSANGTAEEPAWTGRMRI